ncbi:MAG: methionyl-tRNA formyltransferase [Clostridiales bacterium]|nr:methionyl-tRNA formyltransferase [Clostridiales bacterium]
MGTPRFASVVLEKLILSGYHIVACFTQPDKPVGRKMKLTPTPVKLAAEAAGIPVYQPNRLRDDEVADRIRTMNPDLIVTAAYGKILPPCVLSIPKKGCLNVHGSLLPRYRGAAPIQWAIMNGERKTGITIMLMDEGMDTGPLLTHAECPIDMNEDAISLTERLANLGAELLTDTIPGYLAGEILPISQNDARASYAPPITRDQGLIDWTKPSEVIHNQIRALAEWPGAYSTYLGKRIKIYCSEIPENGEELVANYRISHGNEAPGSVICARKDVLAVMCGDGPLLLRCIQPESCRKLQASECAHNFCVSGRFGGEK